MTQAGFPGAEPLPRPDLDAVPNEGPTPVAPAFVTPQIEIRL